MNNAQWEKTLFQPWTIFLVNSSKKIDSVKKSINVIWDDLINKIDNAHKTAESAL